MSYRDGFMVATAQGIAQLSDANPCHGGKKQSDTVSNTRRDIQGRGRVEVESLTMTGRKHLGARQDVGKRAELRMMINVGEID